jgi:hypothetical protein
MTARKIESMTLPRIGKKDNGNDLSASETNMTPRISINGPIENGGFLGLLDLLTQFVKVGGDFV